MLSDDANDAELLGDIGTTDGEGLSDSADETLDTRLDGLLTMLDGDTTAEDSAGEDNGLLGLDGLLKMLDATTAGEEGCADESKLLGLDGDDSAASEDGTDDMLVALDDIADEMLGVTLDGTSDDTGTLDDEDDARGDTLLTRELTKDDTADETAAAADDTADAILDAEAPDELGAIPLVIHTRRLGL